MTNPPTPEQLSALGRYLRSRRKTPPAQKLQPCKYCAQPLGTRARRQHQPECSENPRVRREALFARGAREQSRKSSSVTRPTGGGPSPRPRTPFRVLKPGPRGFKP